MYKNLVAEMARNGYKRIDIARVIGGSYNHVREKINGKYEFEYGEALKIQETLFPEIDLKYLFEKID